MRLLVFATIFVLIATFRTTLSLNASDRLGLLHIIGNMTGLPDSWQSSDVANACDWQGIKCNAANTSIVGMGATYRNSSDGGETDKYIGHYKYVSGELPDTFLNFPELATLEFFETRINGTLPPSIIGYHPQLGYVRVSNGHLAGQLPDVISPSIYTLILRDNLLTGTISPGLAKVSSVISLNRNQLGCPIDKAVWDALSANTDCVFELNRFTLAENGMYCGNIPLRGHPMCRIGPQIAEIPAAPALNAYTNLAIDSDQILVRLIEPERKYVAIHVRDKNTGEFMMDEYFIIETASYSSDQRGMGIFRGFTTNVTKLNDADGNDQYLIDGGFTNGLNITLSFTVLKSKAIKIGWTLYGEGFFETRPTFGTVLYHKSVYQTNSAGIGCTEYNIPPERFTEFLGKPLFDCQGDRGNFTVVVTFDTELVDYYYQFHYESQRADISFLWATTAQPDGGPQIPLITREYYMITNTGIPPLKAFLSPTYGPPLDIVPPTEQFVAIYFPLLYATFNNTLYYDPEIRINALFAITTEDDNSGAVIAGVIGGVLGAVVVGIGIAAAVSPKFRGFFQSFANRKSDGRVYTNPETPKDNQSEWTSGSHSTVTIRNTKD